MANSNSKKSLSISIIVLLSFLAFLIASVGLVSYIIFASWFSSAREAVDRQVNAMNEQILQEIDSFIEAPLNIVETNHVFLEQGIVDLDNEVEREKFFVLTLMDQSDSVYSFSFGSESGEYYGARRNEQNEIEIMRNNESTEGYSQYYMVNDDLTAGELAVVAGLFDPRGRDWYTAAKESEETVFSPIYKHFVMDDLTLSVARPIYRTDGKLQGVLGAHITLSRINNFLQEITGANKAHAMIIEKESGALIANSLGLPNFDNTMDGTFQRVTIEETGQPILIDSYRELKEKGSSLIVVETDNDRWHSQAVAYQKAGLDWLIITSVPESLFTVEIYDNINLAVLLTIIALTVSVGLYMLLVNKYLRQLKYLLEATDKFAAGDLSKRVAVYRNDEIGRVARSFNKMATTIQTLINELEIRVSERTAELESTNRALTKSEDQLRLILDSTAEGIYGIDTEGKCTFCNESCLKLLGYSHQDELIGKNMHKQIHHSHRDGTPMDVESCRILEAFLTGKGTHADDEVLWRKDGSAFDVEYYSYPQFKEGQIIGAVITFQDITEAKIIKERIKYLSTHDALTGLINQASFEEKLKEIDTEDNLPITIIFADVNGLKLTNDIFGHSEGDKLLKKSAEILQESCRENDFVGRIGGDEFTILLPKTDAGDAKKIIARINKEFSETRFTAIKGSLSMGYSTKRLEQDDINEMVKNAESAMYREKTLNRKQINDDLINTVIETLHTRSSREKEHSLHVSQLCMEIASEMGLPETEVKKLEKAGYLHDIGKIVVADEILDQDRNLTKEEFLTVQKHTLVGYRILNLFDNTMDLADGVLSHHEKWDGSGYPKGLRGEEIPRAARIITVAEYYDAMTGARKNKISPEEALAMIKKEAGHKFDPEVVAVFVRVMEKRL